MPTRAGQSPSGRGRPLRRAWPVHSRTDQQKYSETSESRTHLLRNEAAELLAQTLVSRERTVNELLVSLYDRRGFLLLLGRRGRSSSGRSVRRGGGRNGGALYGVRARGEPAGARVRQSDILKAADSRLEPPQERGEVIDAW